MVWDNITNQADRATPICTNEYYYRHYYQLFRISKMVARWLSSNCTWWRQYIGTLSPLLGLCVGNPPDSLHKGPVMRIFDTRTNNRLASDLRRPDRRHFHGNTLMTTAAIESDRKTDDSTDLCHHCDMLRLDLMSSNCLNQYWFIVFENLINRSKWNLMVYVEGSNTFENCVVKWWTLC